ncbi:MAG TPA: helix-turn-helix domain-containing protein [Selenomonadales bacterium]|nr:helix-turn-helix domain-containing protein [Selenomonadales bacterium]
MVLQTVGEVLRTEREKQGLSVKDIEKATSIRALYIQAIEDGNYSILPGEVYLKGFIRNYASFLGLNPQNMMELYRQNQAPQPPVPQTPTTAGPVSSAPSAATPPSARTERRQEKSGGSAVRWVVIGVVVLLLVGGAAWAAMEFFGPAPKQPSVPQPPPKAAQPAPVPTPAPAPVPATPQKPPAQAKPIVVVAKFTAECWTRAVADGKEVYEGIPKVGETLTWSADRSLTVHVGNAAGIELTYNGQLQGKLGDAGDVITKTFSANTTNTP